MDFVVVGCGLGALIVLVGIAVRDFAPRLRRTPAADQPSGDPPGIFSIRTISPELWADACREAALAILAGGALIIVATIGGIAAHFDNSAGARLVLGAVLVAFGAIAIRLGILTNHLFPLDRRARARIFAERLQRANAGRAQTAESAESQPAAADQSGVSAPVVATAIGSNGAAPEPVAAESQPETVSTVAPASEIPDATTLQERQKTEDDESNDQVTPLSQAAAEEPAEQSTDEKTPAEAESSVAVTGRDEPAGETVAESSTEKQTDGGALGATEEQDILTTVSQTPSEVATTTRTDSGS